MLQETLLKDLHSKPCFLKFSSILVLKFWSAEKNNWNFNLFPCFIECQVCDKIFLFEQISIHFPRMFCDEMECKDGIFQLFGHCLVLYLRHSSSQWAELVFFHIIREIGFQYEATLSQKKNRVNVFISINILYKS